MIMGQGTYVDFRAVKAAVSFPMVLSHYGVNWLRESGDELRGRCPIHKGDGDRTFHVNVSKGAFHCFSCKAKGNVLEFVAAMESCSVRDAAVKLHDWFNLDEATNGTQQPARPAAKAQTASASPINPPLGFQLKVDAEHEYAAKRGLSKETLAEFGAGYCLSKGTFAGRFVIPLHDTLGQLVGYAGRSLDDAEPKYLFPSSEKGFHKRYLLFNWHRAIKQVGADGPLIVVEGFFDCMKVRQAGFACVALMGSTLSAEQEGLICHDFSRVVVMLDADQAGKSAATECAARLAAQVWVRIVTVPGGKQPDELSTAEIRELLASL
jgi:DNA primase